ncbi:DNA repair protein rad10 domain-containing protein [Cyclospora cayetanensis]|uniref:DNA repair protein rad10 domain-containing protein n=1 Tax=Cyclospora cayetanensis TaxID=88456 RepID=A0A1D3D364_9EIME|nr:DNA repair protein rad10 domain-containing protein [Cyclospora cayetanensis]
MLSPLKRSHVADPRDSEAVTISDGTDSASSGCIRSGSTTVHPNTYFTSVPYCLAPIAPDFLVGVGTCVVFLSLKFHRLHPKQLVQRLVLLQRCRELSKRFLLLLNDVDGAHASLAQVTLHAFHHGFMLVVAASPPEAAELLQQLKASENRAPDCLQPTLDARHAPRCAEVLRVLPAVNRADFVSLAKEFGCMRSIFLAKQQALQQCPGIGPKKVRALLAAFQEPFFPDTDARYSGDPLKPASGVMSKEDSPSASGKTITKDRKGREA